MTRANNDANSTAQAFGALVLDMALAWALFCMTLLVTDTSPVFRWWWAPALIVSFALYQALPPLLHAYGPRGFFSGRTLGGALWFWARSRTGIATFLTLLSLLPTALLTERTLLSHPYWIRAEAAELPAKLSGSDWSVLPFFFATGAWPTTYDGNVIFHALPYEKGPPEKFPGRVIARWNPPSTLLTLEGPKTPEPGLTPERLRDCFSGPSTFECASLREKVLSRHVREIETSLRERGLGRIAWQTQWLSIKNASVPANEQTQGVYLSARTGTHGEDRFILITPLGSHQAFILNYPTRLLADQERALATFHQSLQSLRATGELAPGRAWIDRRIQDTKLQELARVQDTETLIRRLAEIQSLLVAKVTVDPKTFETYFHLGGTGLMLLRHAARYPDRLRASEWMAVAKPLIQSAYRFSGDVKPGDPRVTQLEGFWVEAQKH